VRIAALAAFRRDTSGSTTVEFVAVFTAFIAIIFFVVEVALYMFFASSLEKAAEAGVRAAVVAPPLISFPRRNIPLSDDMRDGEECGQTECVPFVERCDGDVSCGGNGDCDESNGADVFDCRILPRMRSFNARIAPENVSIEYRSSGIGFAGGPTAPMVTVTVQNVLFPEGILGRLLCVANPSECRTNLAKLPPRSASMTGEDLAR
jgi:hypothetical protein